MDADAGIPDWGALSQGLARLCGSNLPFDESGGGVALPSNPESSSVYLKHETFILYFMLSTEIAASSCIDETERLALKTCAHFPASVLSKEVLHINLHPDQIRKYYDQIKIGVKEVGDANFPTVRWDKEVLAQYLNFCMKTQDAPTEIIPFNRELPPWVQWFIQKAYNEEVHYKYWLPDSPTEKNCFIGLQGLELKQCDRVKLADAAEYERLLTQASNYETLHRLKEHFSSKSQATNLEDQSEDDGWHLCSLQ